MPRLYRHARYALWPITDQWLWALASRTSGTDYPPDPIHPSTPHHCGPSDFNWIQLAADWRGLVLRNGLALAGRAG